LKFSIVTSVLNGATYLSETIRSVSGQSHADFEHLIIDAGSDDGSHDIALQAAKQDTRVRVFSRPGEALYASLLWGLDQAEGDILSWLNADDLYAPWALASVDEYLRRNSKCDWLSGLPGCWDSEGRLRFVRPEGWHSRRLIRQGWRHKDLLGFLQQESMFFSRALYGRLDGDERKAITDCRYAGDFVMWKAFAARAKLDVLPTALGGFRRHGANQSVVNMDAYMDEVRKAGAVFLPWPLRELAQFSHRAISASSAAKKAIREDLDL